MKVCVVGSGGREHALAHVLGRTAEVVVTPGNPGIPGSAPAPVEQVDADLYVVGPEAPLVDGLADRLRADGRLVFGPGADGARLEGSKAWMKELFIAAGVPTAAHASFSELAPALDHLEGRPGPYVIKTDGLAAGKGVLVTESLSAARDAVRSYLDGSAFGVAGTTVVIEDCLTGPELSVFAISDGRRVHPMGAARDFKRLGDGDAGPNTGGMGAFSPVPDTDDVVSFAMDRAVEPTLAELRRRGIDYRGFLFCGLMLTPDGPKVLEYNVRFGDPEAQVVLPRVEGDLAEMLAAAASGELVEAPRLSPEAAVTVVCAAEGYPQKPRTGDVIRGVEAAAALEGVVVFAAGVSADHEGQLVTGGGRVLDVTGFGATLSEARERAYAGVAEISWPGCFARSDIAAAR